jgi:hypothetical protein
VFTVMRLLRRAPLLTYFALVYAASAVALSVIGWPRLDGAGGVVAVVHCLAGRRAT